ncbi:MAG TPA: STAS domain-containing protein [Anaerolineaceae bacterium]|nr:STAS domain-containing protein [Anaerolineaceae bacterium]
MEHTVTEYKRCVLISLKGRIDSYTSPQLVDLLSQHINEGKFKLALDMSGVEFLSSAGWWALINAQKKCRQYNRGEVALACIDQKIRESMDLVGIRNYFRIFDDVTSAVAAF